MSVFPDNELLEAIAVDLGVDPSFVEKDWHAMRMIAAIAGVRHGELRPVFSGGTSLSKGYGLIQRFSEDLDFKLLFPKANIGRPLRRGYRAAVVDAIPAAGNGLHHVWPQHQHHSPKNGLNTPIGDGYGLVDRTICQYF